MYFYKTQTEGDTHRTGEVYVTTVAETGVMQPQGKKHQQSPNAGRNRKWQEADSPSDTLVAAWSRTFCKRMNFDCFKQPSLQ